MIITLGLDCELVEKEIDFKVLKRYLIKVNKMNEIVTILVRRDSISPLEAENLVEECKEEILEAALRGNYEECEDILALELGLEPDYLVYLLDDFY